MTSTIRDQADNTARSDSDPAFDMSDGTSLSWGEVFDEHAPAIASYARARGVRDPEDLVQDVFVAAVKQLESFEGDRSGLRSLLFTIAYRRIADHHRRSYRRAETLVAEHTPRPDPGPTVEQIVDLGESANRAMQAFVVLSDRERRVIEMRLIEEASPAIVGRALGLSSGNVRVIQARALVKIRKHLRSMREGGFAQPLVTVASLPELVRYLRTKLATDRLLGHWIGELRSTCEPTRESSAGSAAVAPGSVVATWATDSGYSLFSAVTSSGAARIGALVSVVALSATPLVPSFVLPESPPALERAVPVMEAHVAEPTLSLEIADDVSGDVSETPTDQVATDSPTSVRSPVREAQQPPASTPDIEASRDPGPPEVEQPEIRAVTVPGLVEDSVEPLVRDTVEVLVDDVVEQGADLVVVVVDSTVGVVDELVDPVLEEVVEPLIDGVTDAVDGDISGLGRLLGGLRSS